MDDSGIKPLSTEISEKTMKEQQERQQRAETSRKRAVKRDMNEHMSKIESLLTKVVNQPIEQAPAEDNPFESLFVEDEVTKTQMEIDLASIEYKRIKQKKDAAEYINKEKELKIL